MIPHFALGSRADVSDPASPGGDSLMVRVGNVDGWFDVRGLEIGDVGITSPPRRVMIGRVTGKVTSSGACAQPRDIKLSATA